jgi:hypothetical protein
MPALFYFLSFTTTDYLYHLVYTDENGVTLMLNLGKRKHRKENSSSKGIGNLTLGVPETILTKHQAAKVIELISDPNPMHGQEIVKITEAVNRKAATRGPEMVRSTAHRTVGRDSPPTLLDSRRLGLQQHEVKGNRFLCTVQLSSPRPIDFGVLA